MVDVLGFDACCILVRWGPEKAEEASSSAAATMKRAMAVIIGAF